MADQGKNRTCWIDLQGYRQLNWTAEWLTNAVDKNKTPEPQNDSGAAFGCGRRIWTSDLRVMSPTSYRTAPSRDESGLLNQQRFELWMVMIDLSRTLGKSFFDDRVRRTGLPYTFELFLKEYQHSFLYNIRTLNQTRSLENHSGRPFQYCSDLIHQ